MAGFHSIYPPFQTDPTRPSATNTYQSYLPHKSWNYEITKQQQAEIKRRQQPEIERRQEADIHHGNLGSSNNISSPLQQANAHPNFAPKPDQKVEPGNANSLGNCLGTSSPDSTAVKKFKLKKLKAGYLVAKLAYQLEREKCKSGRRARKRILKETERKSEKRRKVRGEVREDCGEVNVSNLENKGGEIEVTEKKADSTDANLNQNNERTEIPNHVRPNDGKENSGENNDEDSGEPPRYLVVPIAERDQKEVYLKLPKPRMFKLGFPSRGTIQVFKHSLKEFTNLGHTGAHYFYADEPLVPNKSSCRSIARIYGERSEPDYACLRCEIPVFRDKYSHSKHRAQHKY